MRVLVLGVGKQGSVLVRDLIESDEVSEVVAGDIDIERLKQRVDKLESEKVRAQQIDVTDHAKLVDLMRRGFDVVANALLWKYSVDVAKAAIEVGVNYVDLGPSPNVFQLDEDAKAAEVTVMPSCGLDPGIDSVLEGYGARKLGKVERIYMWCGGIPQKNTPAYNSPLRYKISWWWEGAISTYCGAAKILRDGEIIEVEKLSGPGNPEVVTFPEPVGECEAFYIGAPLLLIEHLGLEDVEEAWSKTVRWPGHCDIWRKLIDLGLTRTDLRLEIKGCEVTPREFLVEMGEKTLQYEQGEGDLVVQRVHVVGQKNGERTLYAYEFMDFYDEENDTTAMARTTAYPCSIIAQMIARGDIKERGVVHAGKIGWNIQLAEAFFSGLAKRGIHIKETVIVV
ncbi:MAG: saccharopine dehydrogenase NADP-binding domain-containing protein [Candidatus Bathyarchaeota archaeon]|nr:saccharopine dehydrogenase NADP-binding domain-containing protein [Candidatus Bathyarchaeota archaeon]